MMRAEAPILEADDLHVYYGESHVLHGVSLIVRAGEAISVLGRNGMGKTTTLRTFVGLLRPRRGEVRVRGQAVTGGPAHVVARLGVALVPEGRGIFPTLSVREHLLLAEWRSTRWTVERIFALFPRLAERSSHMGPQLSGGEQQMLSIGRALMTDPALLILDEATEGLAPLVRKEIWSVIRAIKAAGVATLIVDKDIRALATVSDRSVILAKGRVVHEGPSAELAARTDLLNRHLGVAAAT